MTDMQIGKIQKLEVLKKKTEGFVLTNGKETAMLPNEDAEESIELGDSIEVFLFTDKKGEKKATLHLPDITLESFGWAEVVEVVKNLGVFVDIGIDKEILVSKDDLPVMTRVWPTEGDWLFVSLELDKKGRLLAKPITEGEVKEDIERAPESLLKKTITGRVYRAAKAGSFVLTEEGYRAFIHPNERKHEPRLGETIQGRVIDVKEDGTINVSLLPLKQESMIDDAGIILEYVKEAGGEIPFSDKSDPDDIRGTFHISKAAFKRALGKLLKENKVIQQDGKIIMTTKE